MPYLLSIIAGLIAGSFANVCIGRLPKDESIISPGSHCPQCGKTLRWRDNIPLISFLRLKGKCFYCAKRISWQYPLVELTMAALFTTSAAWFAGRWDHIVIADLLCFYLFTISIIDFHHKIIPDELSLSLLVIGWVVSFWNPYLGTHPPRWAESLLASIVGGGLMLLFAWGGEKIFKKEALGGGDVKLIAAIGAILGWGGLLGTLTLGSFVGALWGGGLLILKQKKLGETLPYGPFLCLGAFVTCLVPNWWTPFLSP